MKEGERGKKWEKERGREEKRGREKEGGAEGAQHLLRDRVGSDGDQQADY